MSVVKEKLWDDKRSRFCLILALTLAFTVLFWFIGSNTLKTEEPPPQVVNEYAEQAYLDITIDNFSLTDRLLQVQCNYWIDSEIVTNTSESEKSQEVRVWIGEFHQEVDNPVATPRFGTPISEIGDPAVLVIGSTYGEQARYPLDNYSAGINVQTDFESDLPFRFNIEHRLRDFELTSEAGGPHVANIILKRSTLSVATLYISLFILLVYSSWATYLIFTTKERSDTPLVSYVGLFIGILALRGIVVPNEIPIGCLFDWTLIIPVAIILAGIGRFLYVRLNQDEASSV